MRRWASKCVVVVPVTLRLCQALPDNSLSASRAVVVEHVNATPPAPIEWTFDARLDVIENHHADLHSVVNQAAYLAQDEAALQRVNELPVTQLVPLMRALLRRGVRNEALLKAAAWRAAKTELGEVTPSERDGTIAAIAEAWKLSGEASLTKRDSNLAAALLGRVSEALPFMLGPQLADVSIGMKWFDRLHFSVAEADRRVDAAAFDEEGGLAEPLLQKNTPKQSMIAAEIHEGGMATSSGLDRQQPEMFLDDDLWGEEPADPWDSEDAPKSTSIGSSIVSSGNELGSVSVPVASDRPGETIADTNMIDTVAEQVENQLVVTGGMALTPMSLVALLDWFSTVGIRRPETIAVISAAATGIEWDDPSLCTQALLSLNQVHERSVDFFEDAGFGAKALAAAVVRANRNLRSTARLSPSDTAETHGGHTDIESPFTSACKGAITAVAGHLQDSDYVELAKRDPSHIVSLRQLCEQSPMVLEALPSLWDGIRSLKITKHTSALPPIAPVRDLDANGGLLNTRRGTERLGGLAEVKVKDGARYRKPTVTGVNKRDWGLDRNTPSALRKNGIIAPEVAHKKARKLRLTPGATRKVGLGNKRKFMSWKKKKMFGMVWPHR